VRSDAALAAGAAGAAAAEVPPPRGKVLSLFYTAHVGGEYQRCDCAVSPVGGLARRATEVDRIRAESDGVVQVDAGDLFLPASAGDAEAARREGERRARLVAAAYARLGVTAYTPGERDLQLGGLSWLRHLLTEAKIPVVSANLADEDGHAAFDADRLFDVAGVRVGIFGVTAAPRPEGHASLLPASYPRRDPRMPGVTFRDPTLAARAAIASLRARGAKLIVALAHVPDVRALVTRAPGIDWAVDGEVPRRLETPELVEVPGGHGARVLGVPSLGHFLGRLDLHVVSGDGGGPFTDRDARATLAARIASHDQQITDLLGRGQMDARQKELLETLRARVAEEARDLHGLPARIDGDWFSNRIVALDTSAPDQPGMAALVAGSTAEKGRIAARVGPPADAKPVATYLGNAACTRCHGPELAFWRTTKHAHAFAGLEAAHSAQSLACVGCHVTGFAQPGGSMDLSVLGTRLRDVGCEACHGPGSAHVDAPRERGLVARAPSAAVCLGCHTPDRTPTTFDFAALTRAVVGPGHGAPLD
jgi:2',3'-cyclic-nucleotide 2'-phosphodiesterase (5'-nucleotidase family)